MQEWTRQAGDRSLLTLVRLLTVCASFLLPLLLLSLLLLP